MGWFRRIRDRSGYHESELIHNLSHSIFKEDFVAHDLWFLNHQARLYCEKCSPNLSELYRGNVKLIRELFEAVPDHLRHELEWDGPNPLR